MPTELYVFAYSASGGDFEPLARNLDSELRVVEIKCDRTKTQVSQDLAKFAAPFKKAIENKFRETGYGLYQKLLFLLFGREEFHCYILIISETDKISNEDNGHGTVTREVLRGFLKELQDYHRTMMTLFIVNVAIDSEMEVEADLYIPYSLDPQRNYIKTIVNFHRFRKKIAKQQTDFFFFITSRLVSIGSLALLSAMWIGWVQEISKKALDSWEWTLFFFGLTLLFLFIAIMSWRIPLAKLRRTRQSSSDSLKIKKGISLQVAENAEIN